MSQNESCCSQSISRTIPSPTPTMKKHNQASYKKQTNGRQLIKDTINKTKMRTTIKQTRPYHTNKWKHGSWSTESGRLVQEIKTKMHSAHLSRLLLRLPLLFKQLQRVAYNHIHLHHPEQFSLCNHHNNHDKPKLKRWRP